MNDNKQNCKPSGSKWKIFWIVTGSVLFLILAAVVTVIMLLFSSPVEIPERKLEAIDFYTQGKIAEKVYRQMRRNAGKLCRMKLNEAEVNSLIRVSEFGHDRMRKPHEMPLRYLQLTYRDGAFSGEFPLDTKAGFLNGGVIKIRFTAKLNKTPEKWSVDVEKVYLGKIKFSRVKANEIVNKALAQADMNDVNKVIQDIYVDEWGKLNITYYPEKLLPLLGKSLNKR